MTALYHATLLPRPRQIQRQQLRQNLLVRQILRPAVGGTDRGIEPAMRGGQPIRAGVVEVGERALLQFLLRQVGRVEPGMMRCNLYDSLSGQVKCVVIDGVAEEETRLTA